MADLLNTATGTIAGDVAQIKTAIYGREVRASIAEAIELLYKGQTEDIEIRFTAIETSVGELSEKVDALEADYTEYDSRISALEAGIVNVNGVGVYREPTGGATFGPLMMHYADGTTSEKYVETEIEFLFDKGIQYRINADGSLLPITNNVNENGTLICAGWSMTKENAGIDSGSMYYDFNGEKITNAPVSIGCIQYAFPSSGRAELVGFVYGGKVVTMEEIMASATEITVTAEQTQNGVTLTITDKDGEHTTYITNGNDGKSAYEIAVENGYTGAEPEWLASLKGEKGDTGATGAKGEQGEKGDKGDKGDTPDLTDLELRITALEQQMGNIATALANIVEVTE